MVTHLSEKSMHERAWTCRQWPAEEISTYLFSPPRLFASNNGSERGIQGAGLQAACPHWSFREQIHAARHLAHVHLWADVHQAHSVDFVLPGLRGCAGDGMRGPSAVLLSVPPRHQAGRSCGPDDDFPLRHLLQPQLLPFQQGDAQWPVPCRGAARFAQRQVCISTRTGVNMPFASLESRKTLMMTRTSRISICEHINIEFKINMWSI